MSDKPKSLYTANDVSKVRKELLERQGNRDIVTGEELSVKDSVTDHDHSTDLVRGITHRQVNAFIGKLENNYVRFIGWWSNIPLPTLLRMIAEYLETPNSNEYYHPKWRKKIVTRFNKLNTSQQREVLRVLGADDQGSLVKRRESLTKIVMKNKLERDYVFGVMEQASGN